MAIISFIAAIAILGGLVWVLSKITYSYLLSPLAAIPSAHWTAPISRLLWTFRTENAGQITLVLPDLHEKYGPLVRIGPQELSFYSMDIFKTVYSAASGFVKDPRVYSQFVQNDHAALFSITDNEEHQRRRRLMGQVFNRSKMPLLENVMLQQVNSFVAAIHDHHNSVIDALPATRALDCDIFSAFGFGKPIGGVQSFREGRGVPAMIRENDNKVPWFPIFTNLPALVLLWERIEAIIYKLIGWRTVSTASMEEFHNWSISRLDAIQSNKPAPDSDPVYLAVMLRSGLHPASALSEAKEMLGPGTDTAASSLAHALYALAHDVNFQDRLVQDCAKAGFPLDLNALEEIPTLRASVKEAIRWTASATAVLPRVVPPEGVVLAGVFVPGGTVVSTSPTWYLHDQHAYPDPYAYRPGRWLNDEEKSAEEIQLRDNYYVPFSKGPNTCIGNHFAYLHLYISLSRILKEFRVNLPYSGYGSQALYTQEARLPKRKEWVVSYPDAPLNVVFTPRDVNIKPRRKDYRV